MPDFLRLEGAVYKVLRTHPHPNILLPSHVVSGKSFNGVIFPAIQDEDLHARARILKGFPERIARPMFRSIVSAVQHCHKHRIVVRDLRLGKVFLKKGDKYYLLNELLLFYFKD